MSNPSLLDRVKRARIFQVLAVYFGAAWVILQIADTLTEALSLPEWVLPVCVLLLLVGLVIILATAWVQSLPSTTAAEEAGERPSDWEVAPSEALERLKRGRLPHLTWARAILGGVVALTLLFAGAGVYALVTGRALGSSVGLGPRAAGADVAAEGIAVVPFQVTGSDELEIWREGMVDLLSNSLDGVGGYRAIDARTVLARWREQVREGEPGDLQQALRAAGATGARYALVGSVVGLGPNVRLVTNIYDLNSGEEVAQGQAEGRAEDVLALTDDLAVGTMRSLLQAVGREGAGDLTAETLTTSSLPALRDFLEGEKHYRRGEFAEAVQSFERAVASDTTFAIAYIRLSEAYGWLEDQNSQRMMEYGEQAMAHTDRLPPRYQFIMDAWFALNQGSPDGLPLLREAVQKYPDDPEAWFMLAETLIHLPGPTMASHDEVMETLDRSVALDPDFAPYLLHLAEWSVITGDRERAEATVRQAETLAGHLRGYEHIQLAIPLILGDSAEAAAAIVAAAEEDARTLDLFFGTFGQRTDRFDRMELLQPVFAELQGTDRAEWVAYDRATQGALAQGVELALSDDVSPVGRVVFLGHAILQWDREISPELEALVTPDACNEPLNGFCHLFLAEYLAREGRWADLDRSVTRLRAAAEGDEESGPWATADVVEAVGLLRRDRTGEARALLERHETGPGNTGNRARVLLGRIALEEGRHPQAIRYFHGVLDTYDRPTARLGLARSYEARGDTARALKHWKGFLVITRLGDPSLPEIVEAREAVARLEG